MAKWWASYDCENSLKKSVSLVWIFYFNIFVYDFVPFACEMRTRSNAPWRQNCDVNQKLLKKSSGAKFQVELVHEWRWERRKYRRWRSQMRVRIMCSNKCKCDESMQEGLLHTQSIHCIPFDEVPKRKSTINWLKFSKYIVTMLTQLAALKVPHIENNCLK